MKFLLNEALPYKLPLGCSLLLHVILLVVVFSTLTMTSSIKPVAQPRHDAPIKAVAVDAGQVQQAMKAIELAEAQKQRAQQLQQRQAQEALLTAKKERAQEELRVAQLKQQQLAMEEAARAKKEAEAKKLATLKKAQQAEKKRLATLEQRHRQEVAKLKLDKQRRDQLARRQQLEKQLQTQMSQEQSKLAAARSKEVETVVSRYMALIKNAVENHWIKPAAANKHLECKLLVQLTGDGSVIDVRIFKSSGDLALDRSAIAAVYKAQPLAVPRDQTIFDKYFRKFTITA